MHEEHSETDSAEADSSVLTADSADPSAADELLLEPGPEPQRLSTLIETVDNLAAQLTEHHARAAARERVIDNLHAEVERLRAGEQTMLLRPVTTDLQNLRKDLLHQAQSLPAEITRDQAVKLLESFALTVELALERCGIAPIRPDIGDSFSPREHRAVKVVPATSAGQDETIAAVVSDGYRDTTTERVTVAARVHVSRWTPHAPEAPAEEHNTDD